MTTATAQRAVRGATWLTAGGYLSFALNLAGNIILARLLLPGDFGVFALVSSVAEVLSLLAGLSFSQGIIQMAGEPDIEDTAYLLTVRLAWGLLGAGVLAAAIMWAMRGPFLAALLLMVFAVRLVTTISYVYSAQLEREFRYRGLSGLRVASAVGSLSVALALAAGGAGVWSLVGRETVVIFLTYAGLRAITRWRYGGRYNPRTAARLVGLAVRMFAMRTFETLHYRTDIFVLGFAAGTIALGFYDRARFLAELGHYAVSFAAIQVAYPLYARFQADPARLAASYRLVHYFLVRAMVPVLLVMAVLPRELVTLLYGSRWEQTATPLRSLAGYAFVLPILDNAKVLLTGIGRLDEVVRIRLVQLLTILVSLALFVPAWGVAGAGVSVTVSATVGLVLVYWALARSLAEFTLATYVKPVVAGGITGLVMVLVRTGMAGEVAAGPGRVIVLAILPALYVTILAVMERGELIRNLRTIWPRGRFSEGSAV